MPTRPMTSPRLTRWPGPDVEARLVQIGGDQALAVIDQGQAALEMHAGSGQGDEAIGGRVDRRARRRGQVDAVVGPGGRAVQDALGAPRLVTR